MGGEMARVERFIQDDHQVTVLWVDGKDMDSCGVEEAVAHINAAHAAKVRPLVEALEVALTHVLELEEAWRRGCLSEHDGLGGTRSNRNISVRNKIKDALEVYRNGK